MGKFIEDFKAFALKGNVIDMAIGVIIGGAFGKIVTSLVNDIIMPVVALCTGSANFTDLKTVLKPEEIDQATGEVIREAVTFNYGMFIQNIVDFFIIAFCIFIALRYTVKFMKKEEKVEEEAPAPEPTKEEVLLTEIRDILKSEKK
ncbi:MAG: large-conductance mechanosensitive channel protein MscL [Muribaculaceae bacterium]|nr:large-conductance mechanosensitive channel protein MscL [Muribaculaceae bacterium]